MIRFREFLAANCHFGINCHCQKCTVVLRNNLSFRKQTRPDTTSFFYDKKYDCRFEISRGHPIPSLEEHHLHIKGKAINLSKRKSSSSRSDRPSIISKRKPSSFRKDSNHHFKEIAIIISKRVSIIISKGQRESFQNDSFACD